MGGHTDGPWYYSEQTMWACPTTKSDGRGEPICTCHNVGGCADEEVRANARLHAASLLLLAACRKLVAAADCQSMTRVYEATDLARDAIARATGEGPPP